MDCEMKAEPLPGPMGARRVPYDERFLEASYEWLNDPELRALMDAEAPTTQSQRAWYEAIPTRPGYVIWGVAVHDRPAGYIQLKRLDEPQQIPLAGVLLADRSLWGWGVAKWAYIELCREVVAREKTLLGGIVLLTNTRSRHAWARLGVLDTEPNGDHMFIVANPTRYLEQHGIAV